MSLLHFLLTLVQPRSWKWSMCCTHMPTMHCNILQYTVKEVVHTRLLCPHLTHCNTLQHTPTHCNTLQHTRAHLPGLISKECSLVHTHSLLLVCIHVCLSVYTCEIFIRSMFACINSQLNEKYVVQCKFLPQLHTLSNQDQQWRNKVQHTAQHCNTLQHTATMWKS